jgi:uncharacterized lipoprotein
MLEHALLGILLALMLASCGWKTTAQPKNKHCQKNRIARVMMLQTPPKCSKQDSEGHDAPNTTLLGLTLGI